MTIYERLWKLPVIRTIGHRIHASRQFAVERKLLRGAPVPATDLPSIVFFTVHKAASIYAGNVCRRLAADAGYLSADFMSFVFKGGKCPQSPFENNELSRLIYRPRGFFYGPFRHYHDGISWLGSGPVILHLRDPRDVLVSGYFSLAFSHYVPAKENPEKAAKILEARASVSRKNINDHVLENARPIRQLYEAYINSVLTVPNVWLSKYELMVRDFETWIAEACRAMQLAPSKQLLADLRAGAKPPTKEDVNRHMRQVEPGDHLRKLSAETVAALDKELAPVLAKLGYEHG